MYLYIYIHTHTLTHTQYWYRRSTDSGISEYISASFYALLHSSNDTHTQASWLVSIPLLCVRNQSPDLCSRAHAHPRLGGAGWVTQWGTLQGHFLRSLTLFIAHELDSPYSDSLFMHTEHTICFDLTQSTLFVLTYYNYYNCVILKARVVYIRRVGSAGYTRSILFVGFYFIAL
jgi:hypothetical protein